jgi:acyl carrier protein
VGTLLSEITAILRGILGDRSVGLTAATRFDDLPDWESTDLITAVVEAECQFNVQFELPEIERLVTIGDLEHMIATKRAMASS